MRQVLIEGLERRGLARPSNLNRVQYDAMAKDLCEKLAYMTDLNLAALEEQAAASPGGKDRDRMPIANKILEWAAQIQPPEDTVSPLMRAVFAAALGVDAMRDGWAPELLGHLRKHRQWPGAYAVGQVKMAGLEAHRRLVIVEERMAAGVEIGPDDRAWRERRLQQLARCQRIATVAASAGTA